jgi:hypothetical protein
MLQQMDDSNELEGPRTSRVLLVLSSLYFMLLCFRPTGVQGHQAWFNVAGMSLS